MYPPQELYSSIKSIESNCKKQKLSNPSLRYQVKLGIETLELWIKNVGDYSYTRVDLNIFGPVVEPNLSSSPYQTNLAPSPPKGRSLKRQRESPDKTRPVPKRRTVVLEDLNLRPSWMNNQPTEGDCDPNNDSKGEDSSGDEVTTSNSEKINDDKSNSPPVSNSMNVSNPSIEEVATDKDNKNETEINETADDKKETTKKDSSDENDNKTEDKDNSDPLAQL